MFLFNCTTNKVGGGLKNSAIFIEMLLKNGGTNWYFAISPEVAWLLSNLQCKLDSRFFIFNKSPSKNLKSRRELLKLTNDLSISLVYTMAGPAYVKFNCLHIMGISNPYITHAKIVDILRFKRKSELIPLFLKMMYQNYYAKFADAYIFQTDQSKKCFEIKYGVSKDRIVVENALDIKRFKITHSSSDFKFNPFSYVVNYLLVQFWISYYTPFPNKTFTYFKLGFY